MFVARYTRTMAGAKRIVPDTGIDLKRKQAVPTPTAVILPFPEPKPQPEPAIAPAERLALSAPPECRFSRVAALANLAGMIRPRSSARAVIAQVAAWHGVGVSDILGQSRLRPIVKARFDAIAAVYGNCRHVDGRRLSLPEVGRHFGGRDHTTVKSALNKLGIPTSRDDGWNSKQGGTHGL